MPTIAKSLNKQPEATAWRLIAERLSNPEYWFTGLCSEIHKLPGVFYQKAIPHKMYGRIDYYLGRKRWAYNACQDREARILAALWMAHEAEEDAP